MKNGNKSDEHISSQRSQLLHRNDEEINSDEEMIPKRKKKYPRHIIRGNEGGSKIQRQFSKNT